MTLPRPLLVTSAVLLTMDPDRPDPVHGWMLVGTDQALYRWIETMLAPIIYADADDSYWLSRHGPQDSFGNGITTAQELPTCPTRDTGDAQRLEASPD